MIKNILITFLLTFSAFSCKIESFAAIVKLRKILDESIIKSSTCSKNINSNFINAINSIEGKIPTLSIKEIMKNEEIVISPQKIEVLSLKNLIHIFLDEENNLLNSLNAISSKNSINLENINSIQLSCNGCDQSGLKNIKLTYDNSNLWISANIIKSRNVFTLNKNYSNNGKVLTVQDVELKKVFTDIEQNLFFDIDNINYYSIKKNLPKGHILKAYDMIAMDLIQAGKTVDLTIESESLSLKTKAIAKANSQIGKTVELINLKTKKTIYATVTGPNQASLKL